MAKISPAGDAARQLLASLPEFAGGDKNVSDLSDAYARRLARGAERALSSGVTPSRQAARGHILAPEHPRSAAPKLPEPPSAYRPKLTERSKYRPSSLGGGKELGARALTTPAPRQAVTGALPERARPRRHARPEFAGHIPFAERGEIYTVKSQREAVATLRYTSGLEPVGRAHLTMQVYDCSRGLWFPVLSHTWAHGGIAIDDFYALWHDHSGSLDDFLLEQINGGATYRPPHGEITHVCLYEITILPRQTMHRVS